jgi:UDP-GlcNAc:undecaprenyl-phosphate GlcNAc-1-phosphate transferase
MRLQGWIEILACLALGFVPCWALIGIILVRARKGLGADRERDFHHGAKPPIPRLGGVAIVAAFLMVAVPTFFYTQLEQEDTATFLAIVVSTLAMFGLGLWDDLRPLGARFKLAGQIAISAGVYLANIRIEFFKDPFTDADIPLGIFGLIATVIWLVGLTNLINLIDGIDGLAGGICLMLMLLLTNLGMANHIGYSTLLSIGVAGAILGFLKYNYPPAKIYMGDGGAYFLGFLIGVLSIVNADKGTVAAALIAPAFALALPIVDVSLAILRRGLRGLPIFRPDQKHIHHHMITLGVSRERTLLNLYTVSLLCLFLALCLLCLQGRLLPLYTGLLVLVLLIAGHLSGFTRNWSGIKSQFGHLLAMRKETSFALTLDRWVVMAAERHGSIGTLWDDYQVMVAKLGFSEVCVAVPDGPVRTWRPDHPTVGETRSAVHEISDGTVIKFSALKSRMPEVIFALLGDLASETWYKGSHRCRAKSAPTPLGSQPEKTSINLKTYFAQDAPLSAVEKTASDT